MFCLPLLLHFLYIRVPCNVELWETWFVPANSHPQFAPSLPCFLHLCPLFLCLFFVLNILNLTSSTSTFFYVALCSKCVSVFLSGHRLNSISMFLLLWGLILKFPYVSVVLDQAWCCNSKENECTIMCICIYKSVTYDTYTTDTSVAIRASLNLWVITKVIQLKNYRDS